MPALPDELGGLVGTLHGSVSDRKTPGFARPRNGAALRGRPATRESFAAAADAELAAATPLPDNGYKVPLARNVVVRTLLELTGGPA